MDSLGLGLLLSFLLVTIVMAIYHVNRDRAEDKRRKIHETSQDSLNEKGFRIDNKAVFQDVAVYVDAQNYQFAVKKDIDSALKIYRFSDLFNVEFVDNGDGGSHGSIGGAIAGGILFGGVGALVGASAGASGRCASMQVRLSVNDIRNPEIILNFISTEISRKDEQYKVAFEAAKSFCGLLAYVTNNRNIA